MLSARKVLFPGQNVHQYNSWNTLLTVYMHCALRFTVLVTTCTCFWRTLQLHFTKFMQYFRFSLVRMLYWKKKRRFGDQHFLSGRNWWPHTPFWRNMETTPIFRMVHCFLVRQTTEKFHSLSNPKRHVHTKHCVISQLNLKVQKYWTLEKFLQV